MPKSYFVANQTSSDITEYKPGKGKFTIPKNSRVALPEELARSIVQDFGAPGLKLVVETIEIKPIQPKPVVKKTVDKIGDRVKPVASASSPIKKPVVNLGEGSGERKVHK